MKIMRITIFSLLVSAAMISTACNKSPVASTVTLTTTILSAPESLIYVQDDVLDAANLESSNMEFAVSAYERNTGKYPSSSDILWHESPQPGDYVGQPHGYYIFDVGIGRILNATTDTAGHIPENAWRGIKWDNISDSWVAAQGLIITLQNDMLTAANQEAYGIRVAVIAYENKNNKFPTDSDLLWKGTPSYIDQPRAYYAFDIGTGRILSASTDVSGHMPVNPWAGIKFDYSSGSWIQK